MSVSRSRPSSTPAKMARPFSVHIFKTPTLASTPGPTNSKFGVMPQNSNPNGGWLPHWSLFNSHFNAPKLPVQRAPSFPYAPAVAGADHVPRNFFIYPSANANGTYIYQSSISNKSEFFSPSDYDTSSSASFTPSTFSAALSSTDSLTTTSSSSPTDALPPLPQSAPVRDSSASENSRPEQNRSSPQEGRQIASTYRSNEYPGPPAPQRQIAYMPHSTPPMPDDHRTLVNTEYNARTSHFHPFRGTSANMSYASSEARSEYAPSIASNPSDILLHPPSSSPERRGQVPAVASRATPPSLGLLPEPPNRLQLVPLPPTSDDGQNSPPCRRDSTFMPYYFPDPASVPANNYPSQYTSQNAGGGTLPLPPGLVFPDRSVTDSSQATGSEMRANSPSNASATSGQDLSGIHILTYDEAAEGSRRSPSPSHDVAPRSDHARSSYASAAASTSSRPLSMLSTSTSTSSTLCDRQVIPPFPVPSPPPPPRSYNGRDTSPMSAPAPAYPNPIPPIPISQLYRRASPGSEGVDPGSSRRSPPGPDGNSRRMSSGQAFTVTPEYGSVSVGRADRDGGSGNGNVRDLQVLETAREREREREWERERDARRVSVTLPPPRERSPLRDAGSGSGSGRGDQGQSQSQTQNVPRTVAGRVRRDSLASAHLRLDHDATHHDVVPSVLAPPSTPGSGTGAEYDPSDGGRRIARRGVPQRRHSADETNAAGRKAPAPYRRHSDGDQAPPQLPFIPERVYARTVRWNENIILPSPIFPDQRRKGFFNKRGDQLWTNTGTFKPPESGFEYPLDLEEYPEVGEGWMNEQGVRIDMQHRLVPKVPLRSALKRSAAEGSGRPLQLSQ